MTISSAQLSVTTTPSVIVADDLFPEEVHIHISSGTLYIGGSNVTTSNGYKLDPNTELVLNNHDNPVYAVAGSGTTTAYVLIITK